MGIFSIWHWLIVLLIVVILFGGKGKISAIMEDLGKGMKAFQQQMRETDSPEKKEDEPPSSKGILCETKAVRIARDTVEWQRKKEGRECFSAGVTSAAQGAQESEAMPLAAHLSELRQRLIRTLWVFLGLFLVSFYFSREIFLFLARPLQRIVALEGRDVEIVYTALHEAFITNVKLAFFCAFFLGSPIILYHIWRFIVPGLYPREKKAFGDIFLLSPLLWWGGAAVAYFWVIPVAWRFFIQFEVRNGQDIPISLLPKVNEYLSLSIHIIVAFAVCFQIPIVIMILGKVGVLKASMLRRWRRIMVVLAFVIAAIFTPPDPVSQVFLAGLLIFLYEGSIFLLRSSERKKNGDEIDKEKEIS